MIINDDAGDDGEMNVPSSGRINRRAFLAGATAIGALALAGCTTTSDVVLKNGEQGLTIDCSGEVNSWSSCYEKADASCAGTGYRIIGTEGTPALSEEDKTLGKDVGNFKGRSVVVVCK